MDARGFHEYVFDGLQPDFQWPSIKFKRNYYPQGITSRGFSDDIFHQSFGMFEPLKRYADENNGIYFRYQKNKKKINSLNDQVETRVSNFELIIF